MSDNKSTIVIKKIKKGGHGHHGGAWKVAYADFVTAMMAFFLLLWLLSATPVENLAGLADYFSPTLGLQGKLGIGFSGGLANSKEGVSVGDWASQGLVFGSPPSGPIIKFPDRDNKTDEDNENNNFAKMEEDISKAIKENQDLGQFKDNILIDQTPEGLKIHITDKKDRPMFKPGSAELMPHTKRILAKITELVKYLPNYIKISGHTRSVLQATHEDMEKEWVVSAERANAARKFMEEEGKMPDEKFASLVAEADHAPLVTDDPFRDINERVTITLLRKSALAYYKQSAPEEILRGDSKGLQNYVKEQEHQDRREKELDKMVGGEKSGDKSGEAGHGASAERPQEAAPAIAPVREPAVQPATPPAEPKVEVAPPAAPPVSAAPPAAEVPAKP